MTVRTRQGLSIVLAVLAVGYLVAMVITGAVPTSRQRIHFAPRRAINNARLTLMLLHKRKRLRHAIRTLLNL